MSSAPRQARRLTEKDWKSREAVIRDLFLKDELPLRKVKAILKDDYEFTASDRQWKHRIRRWNLDKNIKKHEMKAIVRKRQYRILSEPYKLGLNFRVRKFQVDPKKILRWMHEHRVPEDQLYNNESGAWTPSDISCHTNSRQGSPSPNPDTEMGTSESSSQTNTPPPAAFSTHGIATNAPEPTSQADAASVASESLESICRVDSIDMSWAFDAPWKELLDGHPSDQQGYPLGALVAGLKNAAHELNRTLFTCTLAELLQGDLIKAIQRQELFQPCGKDIMIQRVEWNVKIERKALGNSTKLTWAHVRQKSNFPKLGSWLELRLRSASRNRYYREGVAKFRVAHRCSFSDTVSHAICNGDAAELERILVAGEATVFSLDGSVEAQYPIAVSANLGNVELTRLLLEQGSPIYGMEGNIISDIWEGFSDRWIAEQNTHRYLSFEEDLARCKELTTLALEHGAQIDECVDPDTEFGNILFHINNTRALQAYQCQQVLQYLLRLGVDVEFRNFVGQTPLLNTIAEYEPNLGMISAYLAANADISAEDSEGWGYLRLIIHQLVNVSQWRSESGPHSHRELLTMLLRADPRFSERPITPSETPRLQELALNEMAWGIWASVFDDLGWDMGEMNEFASQLRQSNPGI